MKKVYWTVALAALSAVAGLRPVLAAEDAIATVNGDAIAQASFDQDSQAFVDTQKKSLRPEQMTAAWETSRKRMLLEKLIEQRLILQTAQKKKIEVKEKDIEEAIGRVKARFKVDAKGQPVAADAAEAAYKKELAAENITEKQLRESITDQLRAVALTDQIVNERVKPLKQEELQKIFTQVKDQMVHPSTPAASGGGTAAEIAAMAQDLKLKTEERVQLQYILFRLDPAATQERRDAALMQAKQVKAKLDKGANFADMARQYSDDSTTAREGGEAGYVARGELRDSGLSDAIFALPVGGVSDVLKAKPGYEIVRVEEKRAAADVRFDGVRKYLEDNMLRFAARAEWARYVKELRKTATVKVSTDFAKTDSSN